MERFVVSARKYRPKRFSEVKGQQHVVSTLQNALRSGQLAHAFLFCGPKGSGKTTVARLLARGVNCPHAVKRGELCGACSYCLQAPSLNVYELDAASHNTAEDMRQLVERTRRYPPAGGKVTFLIDEAHMLSNAAFNVLLKPLEEPPKHVLFILITTERSKIMPTVFSRCQAYFFHAVASETIVDQLHFIAQQEGITSEERALHRIAEQAAGSLRDALSTFDLIALFSGKQEVTYAATLQHLELLDEALYERMVTALHRQDIGAALLAYGAVFRTGFDSLQFVNGLGGFLRNLLLAQREATYPLLQGDEPAKKRYVELAKVVGDSFIRQAMVSVEKTMLHYKTVLDHRLLVEFMLIKIGRIAASHPADATPTNQGEALLQPASQVNGKASPSGDAPQAAVVKPDTIVATDEMSPRPSVKRRTPRISQEAIAEKIASQASPASGKPSYTLSDVRRHSVAYMGALREQGTIERAAGFAPAIHLTGHEVVFAFASVQEKAAFTPHQGTLLAHLRKQLTPALTLSTKVVKRSAAFASDQERLEGLAAREPSVRYLVQKLGLATD